MGAAGMFLARPPPLRAIETQACSSGPYQYWWDLRIAETPALRRSDVRGEGEGNQPHLAGSPGRSLDFDVHNPVVARSSDRLNGPNPHVSAMPLGTVGREEWPACRPEGTTGQYSAEGCASSSAPSGRRRSDGAQRLSRSQLDNGDVLGRELDGMQRPSGILDGRDAREFAQRSPDQTTIEEELLPLKLTGIPLADSRLEVDHPQDAVEPIDQVGPSR